MTELTVMLLSLEICFSFENTDVVLLKTSGLDPLSESVFTGCSLTCVLRLGQLTPGGVHPSPGLTAGILTLGNEYIVVEVTRQPFQPSPYLR